MTSTAQNITTPQAISVTNFDLSSLYLLRPEVSVTLKNAERHLSEFNDDEDQAPLLLDSVAMLKQLAAVLNLISLAGSSDLADLLADAMQRLYDSGDNTNEVLILRISQGIMTLTRYIEFVLLQETLEPSLLLPVINQLNEIIGRQAINEDQLAVHDYSNIALANPAKNFKSLDSLDIDSNLLATAYRAGLKVLLSAKTSTVTEADKKNLDALFQSCELAAEKSDVLFWKAAAAATKDIADLLPLNEQQKRIFIFLDQQFHNYLRADDSRFADLVSFACLRGHELSEQLREQLSANQLDASQIAQLRQFMFGPDQEIATIVNTIVQENIDDIKADISGLVYDNNVETGNRLAAEDITAVTDKLKTLASTMQILNLNEAAATLLDSIETLQGWTSPTPEELDVLLNDLMIAENAAINLSKSHTPGAQTQPFNNTSISIYQLDTAYKALVDESRTLISNVESAISDYMDVIHNVNKDAEVLKDVPSMLKQVAGALHFLELTDAANVINRLSLHLDDTLYIDDNIVENNKNATYNKYAKVADVLLAIDHELSALQQSHPVGRHAMGVGNNSLNKLIAA